MFLDLHHTCSLLTAKTVLTRVDEFAEICPGVFVTAIGGFPIVMVDGVLHWCGAPITVERVKTEIKRGLGVSAALTYMNKSDLSLDKLGEICVDRDHDWAYRWMSLSLLFSGHNLSSELSFTRDGKFLMSWPVGSQTGKAWVATGSLKDWVKFLSHKDDPDFDSSTRSAMNDASLIVGGLLP